MQQTELTYRKARILLADMHQVVRNGIRQQITNQMDMEVVGETVDGYEVLDLVDQLRPDVVILDVKLSGQNGVKVTRCLTERGWGAMRQSDTVPDVLAFTAYSDKQYVWSMLAAGAKGYLLKSEPLEQLMTGIRWILAGQTILSQTIQTNIIKLVPSFNQQLSDGEIKVMHLLAQGLSNVEIAQKLHVAEGTVKSHLNNIYHKIPWIRTRAEAIAWVWVNHVVSTSVSK